MKASRALLLGACAIGLPLAAAAIHAQAAEPSPQRVVLYDITGRPVAVLTPIGAQPNGERVRDMRQPVAAPVFAQDPFAQMDAMMASMMARMNTFAAMPFPAAPGGFPAGMVNAGVPGGAGQMVVSTFSSGGHGSCSETVTYRSNGSGPPQVAVQRVGDACGVVTTPGNRTVPAALPQNEPAAPAPAMAPGQRLYNIDYRHPSLTGAPQRG